MRGYCSTVPGMCGLGVVHSFDNPHGQQYKVNVSAARLGGIDFSVAGFTDTKRCQKTYNVIKESFDIVFQSPVKRNRNSGNMFFFIVFKRKEAP